MEKIFQNQNPDNHQKKYVYKIIPKISTQLKYKLYKCLEKENKITT